LDAIEYETPLLRSHYRNADSSANYHIIFFYHLSSSHLETASKYLGHDVFPLKLVKSTALNITVNYEHQMVYFIPGNYTRLNNVK